MAIQGVGRRCHGIVANDTTTTIIIMFGVLLLRRNGKWLNGHVVLPHRTVVHRSAAPIPQTDGATQLEGSVC